VPIVATSAGGIVDPKGAGLRFPIEADGEQVAEALAGILREPERYATMRKAARQDGGFYSWDRTADEMRSLLDGSSPDT
jgi:glycosyltransferase involved in cell wall biosynthesis